MNYPANTKSWRIGDLVIHDADQKKSSMLIRVCSLPNRDGEVRVRYAASFGFQAFDADPKYLHDPNRFGIPVDNESQVHPMLSISDPYYQQIIDLVVTGLMMDEEAVDTFSRLNTSGDQAAEFKINYAKTWLDAKRRGSGLKRFILDTLGAEAERNLAQVIRGSAFVDRLTEAIERRTVPSDG